MSLRPNRRCFIAALPIAIAVGCLDPADAKMSNDLAVLVAKAIARYEGYTPSKSLIMDYDLVDRFGQPAYRGYVAVQVMSNAHAVANLSINMETGQVADFLGCYVYAFPVIARTEYSRGFRARGHLSYGAMMAANGCDTYVILRHPRDEARDLRH